MINPKDKGKKLHNKGCISQCFHPIMNDESGCPYDHTCNCELSFPTPPSTQKECEHKPWNRKIDCSCCRKIRPQEEKLLSEKAQNEKLSSPSMSEWEKEFDTRFFFSTVLEQNLQMRIRLKSFIKSLLLKAQEEGEKNGRVQARDEAIFATEMKNLGRPIGVSQWLEYGKKYEYSDFFIQQAQQEVVEEILKLATQIEDDYGPVVVTEIDIKSYAKSKGLNIQ